MKPRVFFLTSEPPKNTMGGEITFYRQFLQSDDYELFVSGTDQEFNEARVPSLVVQPDRWLERLKHTRISNWVHDYANLVHGNHIERPVLRAAKNFQPDIIYALGGCFRLTRMAASLARKLDLPLAVFFMDWSTYNFLGHPWARRMADQQYRQAYRDCDLAFCICEGMKDELGPHANAHVHYPICGDASQVPPATEPPVAGRFRITFAGNLGEWYGELLRELVEVLRPADGIDLRIYGKFHRWPAEFEKQVRERGIYRGFLPFDQLAQALANTDALFLMMGFGAEARLIESTSFKTKFLEYLPFQKPILVWGPEYCTAVTLARKHGSAMACTSREPGAIVGAIRRLREDVALRQKLVANANRMYANLFDPAKTKASALARFRETIQAHRSRTPRRS